MKWPSDKMYLLFRVFFVCQILLVGLLCFIDDQITKQIHQDHEAMTESTKILIDGFGSIAAKAISGMSFLGLFGVLFLLLIPVFLYCTVHAMLYFIHTACPQRLKLNKKGWQILFVVSAILQLYFLFSASMTSYDQAFTPPDTDIINQLIDNFIPDVRSSAARLRLYAFEFYTYLALAVVSVASYYLCYLGFIKKKLGVSAP